MQRAADSAPVTDTVPATDGSCWCYGLCWFYYNATPGGSTADSVPTTYTVPTSNTTPVSVIVLQPLEFMRFFISNDESFDSAADIKLKSETRGVEYVQSGQCLFIIGTIICICDVECIYM